MTDPRACRTCSFFVGDDKGGECHRGPPTAVVVMERNLVGKLEPHPYGIYPPVQAGQWCGEWVLTTKMAAPIDSDVIDLAGKISRSQGSA